jgi:hypothetical protein
MLLRACANREGGASLPANAGGSVAVSLSFWRVTAGYCGFPKALNATFVGKRLFAERDLLPDTAPAA